MTAVAKLFVSSLPRCRARLDIGVALAKIYACLAAITPETVHPVAKGDCFCFSLSWKSPTPTTLGAVRSLLASGPITQSSRLMTRMKHEIAAGLKNANGPTPISKLSSS